MIEGLWKVANGYRSGIFGNYSAREKMLQEHDDLLDACRHGDASRAKEIMETHRMRAANTLISLTADTSDEG